MVVKEFLNNLSFGFSGKFGEKLWLAFCAIEVESVNSRAQGEESEINY